MLIKGGTVVIGDGRTSIDNGFVLIRDQAVAQVGSGAVPLQQCGEVVDASGSLVIPGIINSHAHACVPGPLFPVAKHHFAFNEVISEQTRHLRGGETTVLNLCGFCIQEEVDLIEGLPLNVRVATSHLRAAIKAADLVDGSGLTQKHRHCTAEQRLSEGAVAIGEIGAGHLLGGGGQDYEGIPRTIERATGVWLRPDQARELKWAILGKKISPEAFDRDRTNRILEDLGISDKLSASKARKAVCDSVLLPLAETIKGYEAAAALSAETGRPAIFHNCPLAVGEITRLARKYPKARLVAGHSNQADFEIEEAVEWARRLRNMGVTVDISTWDSPGQGFHADPEKFKIMLSEGVVDTISTDYAGGEWEPILKGLALAVSAGALSIVEAVALATGNVARLLPEVGGGRGVIAPGKIADLVLVDKSDIGIVRDVIIKGKFVVRGGQLVLKNSVVS